MQLGRKARNAKMKVTMIYGPEERELKLCLHAIWVTMGKTETPAKPISSELLSKILRARHSPIRVLNFAFLIEDIPSNIATHLARHIHAVSFVSSLRNDRQDKIDGDTAPRNTPVNMIFYCNAEELMIVANKRLCGKASEKTREAVERMCACVEKKYPEFQPVLVPMCIYHGNVCYEIEPCWRRKKKGEAT